MTKPKLALTTVRDVALAALAGAVVGVVGLGALSLLGQFPPQVPWTVPGLLAAIGVGAFIYARALPGRLEERRVTAEEAVRALVVAKSMILTGAILAGGHVVYVGRALLNLRAEAPAGRALVGGVTIVVATVFAWVGWYLERKCIVDDDDDEHGTQVMPAPDPA